MTQEQARLHYKEIERWAKAPDCTKVWNRESSGGRWFLTEPVWSPNYVYVVDDEWAELRKVQIDGKQLQLNDLTGLGWINAVLDEQYMRDTTPDLWRIKPETEYPVFLRSKKHPMVIVKLQDEETGSVVMAQDRSLIHKGWGCLDFRDEDYETVEAVEINGQILYDTQPVLAWDAEESTRTIGFFNAQSKCLFTSFGYRSGMCYDYYAPVECIEPWIIEAWQKLKI